MPLSENTIGIQPHICMQQFARSDLERRNVHEIPIRCYMTE